VWRATLARGACAGFGEKPFDAIEIGEIRAAIRDGPLAFSSRRIVRKGLLT
jgi:hypothetical protein